MNVSSWYWFAAFCYHYSSELLVKKNYVAKILKKILVWMTVKVFIDTVCIHSK